MQPHTFSFRAMNTNISVWLEPHRRLDRAEAEQQMRALFAEVERTCSRFLPDSELCWLNRTAGRDVQVSPMLFNLLEMAYDAYLETDGWFNPIILPALEHAGYRNSFEQIRAGQVAPYVERVTELLQAFPYTLGAANGTVRLTAGQRIDLGGIAKGWTVDRAAAILAPLGRGYVNAGGDLRVFGAPNDGWRIGVEDPDDAQLDVCVLTVHHGAVATSSTSKRRWLQGDTWHHHLIDPFTGRPSESMVLSATVTAPSACQADVWAKTALLLGPERGTEWIKQRCERAVLIDRARQVRRIEHAMA